MAAAIDNWIGRELAAGRYVVGDRLGEGGMALVYRARDRHLEADVVLKVPRQAVLGDPQFVERFAREVRSLVRLAHPHVVRITDVGNEEGVPYAVMQYLPGGSLKDRQARDAEGRPVPLAPGSFAGWLPDLATALDFIHAQGYIHRDVKPANILFDEHGHVYLSDFGVAKALAASAREAPTVALTGSGVIVGTPEYMAPELLLGQPFDGRADQYALSVTLYELLGGRRPFEGGTPAIILMQHVAAPPVPLSELQPAVPAGVAGVVMKAMAKEPGQRFANCRAFVEAYLAEVKRPSPPHPYLPPGAGEGKGGGLAPARPGGTLQETIELPCPACRQPLSLSELVRGRRIRCPKCQAVWRASDDLQRLVPADAAPVERTATTIEARPGLVPAHLVGQAPIVPYVEAERRPSASVVEAEQPVAAGTSKAWIVIGVGLALALGLVVLGAAGITAALLWKRSPKPEPIAKEVSASTSEPARPVRPNPGPALVGGTLVVSQQGGGQFATIGEAVRAAQPGSRIQVGKGTYRESLTIDKQLEIVGNGPAAQVILEGSGGTCVTVNTDQPVLLRGLTLRGIDGPKDKAGFALQVTRGPCELDGCDLTAGAFPAVAVNGPDAHPTLRHCTIHDGREAGVSVWEKARAQLEDCDVSGNTGAAVMVQQGAQASLVSCRLHGGKREGMAVLDGGQATLERCDLFGNAGANVEVKGGQAVLKRCRIHDGKGAGLYLHQTAKATVDDCDIETNALAGIEVEGDSTPLVRLSRIRGGKQGGVLAHGNGRGTFEQCDISGNTYAAVELRGGADPVFRDCKFHDGQTSGVYAHTGGLGKLEDCLVFTNRGSGVSVGTEGNPTFVRCKIYDNKGHGVHVFDKGRGLLENCDVHGNALAAVGVKQGSNPVVRQCRLYDGNECGVLVLASGEGRFETCQIYGNTYANVEIREAANPVFHGCKIHSGKTSGVYFHGKAKGTLEDCEIYANTLAGIEIKDGANPMVRHCTVRDGKQSGIYINVDGQGTLVNCTVSGHAYSALAVNGAANALVQGCKLSGSGGSGVHLYGKGRITLENCDIFRSARAGVEVTDGGELVLRKCHVYLSKFQAVWVYKGGGATVENCNLTDNERGSFKIEAGCVVHKSGNTEDVGNTR
jgi:F-box protein 11